MASDYSILEKELTDLKMKLQRDLHMHQVRRLSKKQQYLAMEVSQRKQIENLEKQLAELESKVSAVYCPQNAVKDNEIQGYLVYLLKMKDFFMREIATKQEMIAERESQIRELQRKHCSIVNAQAKIIKNIPVKTPEFVQLENLSNRMNQMNKRISTMRQENKEIVENIMNMRKFQEQFKAFEKDFRRKINKQKAKSQELLEKAVSAYEEKEEFMIKKKTLEESTARDARKTAINENALNLCLQKTEKNEDFAKVQNAMRTDARIAQTSEMMEKLITGLEPSMAEMQNLQEDISAAAGEETPEKMEESFRTAEHKIDMMFSYLDELLRDINQLQNEVSSLKKENKKLIRSMNRNENKLRKAVKAKQDIAEKKLYESNKAIDKTDDAKSMLESLLDTVSSLYTTCCPEDKTSLETNPINPANVTDYLQNIEKQLLDYLIFIEYIKFKEASKEDQPVVLEAEEAGDVDDQTHKTEDLKSLQPRYLSSEYELESLVELDTEDSFLEFEDLKSRAVAALSEIQSEASAEEEGN